MKTKVWLDGAGDDFVVVDGHLTKEQAADELDVPRDRVVDVEWHHVDEPGEPDHQD